MTSGTTSIKCPSFGRTMPLKVINEVTWDEHARNPAGTGGVRVREARGHHNLDWHASLRDKSCKAERDAESNHLERRDEPRTSKHLCESAAAHTQPYGNRLGAGEPCARGERRGD